MTAVQEPPQFHTNTYESSITDGTRPPDDDGLAMFLSVRPRLLSIAYRMLGSMAEAEDLVQDAWVRWQTADRSVVQNAPAFLTTTTTRLAINVIRSARSRHETAVGDWLPEPADSSADPSSGAEEREALELAVLILLETLSPAQRSAYVLREAFDYPYREIAATLRLEEANTRQLVTRARQHLGERRGTPRGPAAPRQLVDTFVSAVHRGDVAALQGLLCA